MTVPRTGQAHQAARADVDRNTTEVRAQLGHRVILRSARSRASDAVGTVIANDTYADRDAVLLVRHDDGVDRWRQRIHLRVLGQPDATPSSLETLAWDLQLQPPAHLDPALAAIHAAWASSTTR